MIDYPPIKVRLQLMRRLVRLEMLASGKRINQRTENSK